MSNLKTIIKYTLINSLGINRLSKKNRNGHSIATLSVILLLSLIAVVSLVAVFFYMLVFAYAFKEQGQPQLLFLVVFSISSVISLIYSLMRTDSELFHCKDYEFLCSLPIKNSTIVISKVISLFLINYLWTILIFLPSTVAYGFVNSITFIDVLKIFCIFIATPFVPVAIAGLISYFLGYFFSKLKYKNIYKTIFLMLITIGIVVLNFSFSFSSSEEIIIENWTKGLTYIFYPSAIAFNGYMGDLLQFLLYIIGSILLCALFVFGVSKYYVKANIRSRKGYTERNYQLNVEGQKNPLKSLLLIEFKKYFSFSGYVMNTLFSPIMGTILIVLFAVEKDMLLTQDIPFISTAFTSIAILMSCFASGMSPTTSVTISLEGKNMWILKTLPIKAWDIFLSKILITIILYCPFTIINAVIMKLVFDIGIIDCLFIVLIPCLLVIVIANYGLLFNILFPRLDWDNPMRVVKGSVSLLLSMVFSFIITGLFVVAFIFLLPFLSNQIYLLLIYMGLLIVLLLISLQLLNKVGVRLYQKISA